MLPAESCQMFGMESNCLTDRLSCVVSGLLRGRDMHIGDLASEWRFVDRSQNERNCNSPESPRSSSGPGRRVLNPVTGVRIPYGVLFSS